MGAFLMYHELERRGRPLCDDSPGYVRYVVREEAFLRQLDHLRAAGLAGTTVSRALDIPHGAVAITFDDGCETDLIIAAPALSERRFSATFYITTRFLDQRGFLEPAQLRQLAALGFEIGSHGVTHRFLSDLPDDEIRAELGDSKRYLEDVIGRDVAHFSCPGGRWDARVALLAREAGYASVATSRMGGYPPGNERFNLPRAAVLRHTSMQAFDGLCRSRPGALYQVRDAALHMVKAALGNRAYVGLRSATLLSADYSQRAFRRLRGAPRG